MHFDYGTITHYGVGFQQLLLYIHFVTLLVKRRFRPTTPRAEAHGLGCSLFARRYLGNVVTYVTFFSFPLGTEMFHFPRCAPQSLTD